MSEYPPRLKDLLPGATGRLGIRSPEATGRVWSAWSEIVGPAVAAHAEPTSLRDGVLRVRADSPAWATEIGYLVEEIRARINAATGSPLIAEVRVWSGPGRTPETSTAATAPQPSDEGERERPEDPMEALERARRAWARRRPR